MCSRIGRVGRHSSPAPASDLFGVSATRGCKDQTYALCAAARCNVYDGSTYCQCEERHGDSISLPFSDGQRRRRLLDQRRRHQQQIHGEYLQSALANHLAAGRRRGLHLRERNIQRRLCPVRRRTVLPKHRGYDVPGLRQACAEGADYLLLPHHSGQARYVHGRLSDQGTLPVRQVVLQILQGRCRQQQHGFDDLCRRPGMAGLAKSRVEWRRGFSFSCDPPQCVIEFEPATSESS